MKKQNIAWTAARLLLGISIIGILIYRIGLSQVLSIISSTSPLAFIIIAGGYAINWLLNSWSYHLLLSHINVKIKYSRLLSLFVASWSIGTVLPGKIGDVSIAYFLKKEGIRIRDTGAIYLMDKGIVFLFYMIIAIITAGLLLPADIMRILLAALAAFGIAAVLFVCFGKSIIQKIFGKYAVYLEDFHANISGLVRKRPLLLIGLFFLSAARWAVLSVSMWILLLMAGEHISFGYVFLFSTTANILALIPITASGIGLKEAAFVYLYALVGASKSAVLGVSLVYSIITLVIAFCVILLIKSSAKKAE
ncbi:MAG TPA: flippase-like domain-containing protein [Nanoarchaeota archaeon]|nr:flippase-like domain-containing protein [Nanoarchaeota archaeon]